MEWIEVEAPTVDAAVGAAVKELGLDSAEQVVVEIIREPKRGILGIGSQDALVKVTPKPAGRKRRRRRGGRSGASSKEPAATKEPTGKQSGSNRSGGRQSSAKRPSGDRDTGGRGSGSRRNQGGQRTSEKQSRDGGEKRQRAAAGAPSKGESKSNNGGAQGRSSRGGRRGNGGGSNSEQRRERVNDDSGDSRGKDLPEVTIEEQAEVAKDFLVGLLDAFGLEGSVETRIEDDILYLNVSGASTEALVGPKGTILQSILELIRTVVQRKTYGAPRMRLDIAGYAERRREALKIYAAQLADRVLADGGEVMLEPMNPADRKVVHDAIAEIEGVRSFSEGEDPHRSVVVARED